jgi:tetratricopeptide (TPR) repeat protein
MARIHFAAGRREASERHAAAAVATQPGEAYELLAQSALAAGRLGEAEAFARHAVEADPSRAVAYFVHGLAARARGRCEDALPALQQAEEARSRKRSFVIPGLLAATGDCLVRLGREADAERAFQAELAAVPHSVEGRVGLAILYRAQGRDAESRTAITGVVTAHPRPGAAEYWTVLRTLRGLEDEAGALAWARDARRLFPADPRFR